MLEFVLTLTTYGELAAEGPSAPTKLGSGKNEFSGEGHTQHDRSSAYLGALDGQTIPTQTAPMTKKKTRR